MKKEKDYINMMTLGITSSACISTLVSLGLYRERIRKHRKNLTKFNDFEKMLLRWIEIRQLGKSISPYFTDHGLYKIAIYGMRAIGECVENEMKSSGVSVEFGIDRNHNDMYSDIKVYSPDDFPKNVDVVVVTPIYAFDEIKGSLRSRFDGNIISLSEVVNDVYLSYFAR